MGHPYTSFDRRLDYRGYRVLGRIIFGRRDICYRYPPWKTWPTVVLPGGAEPVRSG